MSRIVLDSSAILAVLLDEPRRKDIETAWGGAMLSTVNYAEVVQRMIAHGLSAAAIVDLVDAMAFDHRAPDRALAVDAGAIAPGLVRGGLSLADRFCLALARREGAVALTADRAWAEVAEAVGVTVEVVR